VATRGKMNAHESGAKCLLAKALAPVGLATALYDTPSHFLQNNHLRRNIKSNCLVNYPKPDVHAIRRAPHRERITRNR